MGLRVGDLLERPTVFKAKYRQFVSDVKTLYNIESFDDKAEYEELRELAETLKKEKMIVDTVEYMHKALKNKSKSIIAEGANAALLDLDFGTYPYVTSSSTTIGGVSTGLGVPPKYIKSTIGIVKAYTTRVGGGPFPTELNDETGEKLRSVGHEFGSTTGRPRRCGWLDLNVVRYSHKLNGFDSLNLTKLDVLTGIPKIKVAVGYNKGKKYVMPASLTKFENVEPSYVELDGWTEDISKAKSFDELPANAQKYINFIESELKLKVSWIGNGPKREEMIHKDVTDKALQERALKMLASRKGRPANEKKE